MDIFDRLTLIDHSLSGSSRDRTLREALTISLNDSVLCR
jgi:hypothetical protein